MTEIDYTKLDAPGMLQAMGLDGYKWMEAFRQMNPGSNVDDDVMLGWFCNAIMNTLDTERGTVHNGDHAQYLLDNNLTPENKLPKSKKCINCDGNGCDWCGGTGIVNYVHLSDLTNNYHNNAKAIEAIGWTWAEACSQMDAGKDPRQFDMAELLPMARKDLEL